MKQAFYTFQEKTQQGQRPGEHGTAARELGTQHCSRRERAWWEAEGNKTGRLGSALCVLPVPSLAPDAGEIRAADLSSSGSPGPGTRAR